MLSIGGGGAIAAALQAAAEVLARVGRIWRGKERSSCGGGSGRSHRAIDVAAQAAAAAAAGRREQGVGGGGLVEGGGRRGRKQGGGGGGGPGGGAVAERRRRRGCGRRRGPGTARRARKVRVRVRVGDRVARQSLGFALVHRDGELSLRVPQLLAEVKERVFRNTRLSQNVEM